MTASSPHVSSPVCRRCGQCCRAESPALHLADLPLVRRGALSRTHLVTLRRGETVNDNVAGRLTVLEREMVKIAVTRAAQACVFYDAASRACRIHASRPVECRALFCEDTSAIEGLYQQERLTRADILNTEGGLWELVSFHDRTFPADTASELTRQAATGHEDARKRLTEMVQGEASFRRVFLEKTGVPEQELDFYFGRSLARICSQFGVKLTVDWQWASSSNLHVAAALAIPPCSKG